MEFFRGLRHVRNYPVRWHRAHETRYGPAARFIGFAAEALADIIEIGAGSARLVAGHLLALRVRRCGSSECFGAHGIIIFGRFIGMNVFIFSQLFFAHFFILFLKNMMHFCVAPIGSAGVKRDGRFNQKAFQFIQAVIGFWFGASLFAFDGGHFLEELFVATRRFLRYFEV